jgi:prolyl-tRNA editing enzyme YbaK/EbsC (Cys-tRNA(Pro) deacylase)
MNELAPSAKRVQDALHAAGVDAEVRHMPDSTRTAEEAAAAVGCSVAQIAKSLIFRGKTSGEPVLVIASGSNRVDEKKVAALIGEAIERAPAELVREATGFAIGGVPPSATCVRCAR